MKALFYRIRVPLLEWYFVAACCYFLMIGMDLDVFVVAIIIGFVNTYLVTPIILALEDDAEESKKEYYEQAPKTLKNVLKSLLICYGIVGIYYVVNEYWFPTAVNPFSFGAIYWILDQIMRKLIKKWN